MTSPPNAVSRVVSLTAFRARFDLCGVRQRVVFYLVAARKCETAEAPECSGNRLDRVVEVFAHHGGVWCNWQHNGFWYRHSRFESWYPPSADRFFGVEQSAPRSSSGLGRRPLTAVTPVQIRYGGVRRRILGSCGSPPVRLAAQDVALSRR